MVGIRSPDPAGLPARALRVIVGIAAGDMMFTLTALHFAGLIATSRENGVEAIPIVNLGSVAVNNRSILAMKAREFNADAILFIDCDMVFPPDALLRLLSHGDHDIIGATYSQRAATGETHGSELKPDGTGGYVRLDVSKGGDVREVDSLPCGMLLVRRRVLDAITASGDEPFFRFPFDRGAHLSRSEDYDFCRRARELGFSTHVDPELSLALGHIGTTVYTITRGAESG